MPLLHVRVTHESTDLLTEVAVWCHKNSKLYLCVEEQANNKHCHIVLDYPKSRANFIKLFNNKFPQLNGNREKSIADLRTTLTINLEYLCKGEKLGDLPKVLLSNLSTVTVVSTTIEDYHQNYWSKHQRLEKEKLKAFQELPLIEKTKKQKKDTWFEKTCNDFIEDIGERKFRWNTDDILWITDYVLKKLGNSRKIIDEFIVKRFVWGLYNHYIVSSKDDELLKEQSIRLTYKMFPDL